MEDYIYNNAEKNIKFQTFLGDTYNIIIYLFTMCIFIFSSEIEILLALLLLTVYVVTISYFFIKSIVKSKKKETIKFSKTTNNYTQELNKSISVFNPVLVSLATIFNFETWQEGKSLFILALSFFVMICIFHIIEKNFFKIKNDLKIILKKINTKNNKNNFIAIFNDKTTKQYKNIFSFKIINDKDTEEKLKSINKTKFYIKKDNEQKEYIKFFEINNSKNESLLIYSELNNDEIKVATDCLKAKKDFLVSFLKEIKNYDIIPSVSNIFIYIYSISILFVNERMYTLISLATIFLYFMSTCFCKKISKYLFLKRNINTINEINKILADFSPFIIPLFFLVNVFINKKLLIFMSLCVLVLAFFSPIKCNYFKKKKPENFQLFIEFTDKTIICVKINFLDYFKYITPDTHDYIVQFLLILIRDYFRKEISDYAYSLK